MSRPNLQIATIDAIKVNRGTSPIKIDKGIPLLRGAGGRTARFPFRQMEIGDSFLFPAGYAISHYYNLAREFTAQCRDAGERKKFASRKTPQGYRCWRIE